MRPDVLSLFPTGVCGADTSSVGAVDPLFPEESQAVSRAVDKRRVEFALGRTCARRALSQLGVSAVALAPKPDRSVPWPAGTVGSITHTEGYAAAVVASLTQLRGIGIDAEVTGRVQAKLWEQIAGAEEQAWFRCVPEDQQALRATLLFSAKEAFYKAQYCVSQAWVGFHDVVATFGDASFSIELLRDIAGLAVRGTTFSGRFVVTDQHVVTSLWLDLA